jgi:cellulose synthase (UDP-forming)
MIAEKEIDNITRPAESPDFYFRKFEDRMPPEPVPYSMTRELIWQFLAVASMVFGARYIYWRWTASLNYDALWFALPVAIVETASVIGLFLFFANLWKTADTQMGVPPQFTTDCETDKEAPVRRITVDVFFPTYNEDPELVRLSILDAKKMTYPHAIDIRIHVLDDGRRDAMRAVAMEEGVGYITRSSNVGFKAGNLRNGMEHTSGDFLLICDADTRPFPTFLEHTLGYFRNPHVAWVQTPQWFYDVPEGQLLRDYLGKRLGRVGSLAGRAVEFIVGDVRIGRDVFGSDPAVFYDAILRRRNWANAAFCCGAGSIHRREAVMQVALRNYTKKILLESERLSRKAIVPEFRSDLKQAITHELVLEEEVTPYKFHVSEDIYTSIMLHEDRQREWRSVHHPQVESKMLSPQDLLTVLVQRFKYAGGTMDIMLHDNPLFRRGLRWPQKLMYASTFWSYVSCLLVPVFLLAPSVYFFTGATPVSAYSVDFYRNILPFALLTELAMTAGLWGLPNWRGKSFYLALFPVNLKAFFTVLRRKKIGFPVTPKIRQEGNFLRLVLWQIAVIALTAVAMLYGTVRLWIDGPGRDSSAISAWLANTAWASYNIILLSGVVRAAFWKPEEES